jgi:protein-tyrosine-phosphatase/tRNA A37 threonylcarbamoyladenosine synthetase subunit TsaC/SUA5/YrdC
MTKVLDWRRSDDPRDVVHLAVQALVEGHVIAVPSSHGYLYLASGLKESGAQVLASLTQGYPGLCLLVRSPDEPLDYFPDMSLAARRLARKTWPGQVVMSLPDSHAGSVLRCVPASVGSALEHAGKRIQLWQPMHELIAHLGRLIAGPLLCCPALTKNHIVDSIENISSEGCVLAIDDGRIEHVGEPTLVQVDGNIGRLLHQGTVDSQQLQRLSRWTVLFVCTGNTCRSPMAQAMMQRKLAEKFGADSNSNVVAISAGVSAFGGDPASHGALAAIQQFGSSLDTHQSTQLNSALVEQADLILAMGTRHRQVILSQWPSVAHKLHLVSPDGSEISDPFGGPLDVYMRCAQQLDQHTDYWISQLDLNSLIQWR